MKIKKEWSREAVTLRIAELGTSVHLDFSKMSQRAVDHWSKFKELANYLEEEKQPKNGKKKNKNRQGDSAGQGEEPKL